MVINNQTEKLSYSRSSNIMNELFNGFPREMLGFLTELSLNNTVYDIPENLKKYKACITEPLISLYKALLPVAESFEKLETKQSKCVSTPYTDRRFSPDTPLKEYMYIRFKQCGMEEDVPGLYFDMGADFYSYGLRIYNQTAKGMDRLRAKILEKPAAFTRALENILSSGFEIIGDRYKKDRYPELPDSIIKDLLNRKRFYIGKDVPVSEKIFTPSLAGEITDGFLKMKDMLELL